MGKKVQWYLMPRDTHTKNKIIQGLLDKGEMVDPSSQMEEVITSNRKKLPMIPVPEYFFVAFTQRSAADSGYNFVPYVRQGDGLAQVWKLDKRKKVERSKELRRIKKKLEDLKK